MNYRLDKYGNKLSVLGFGCLRFPTKAGRINIAETEAEIMTAIHNGVNYFDTAYIYPGSEAALGEILERNGVRDQVYIATKLPHYLIKSREGMEKLFNEELRRLRTDHVDYYLMHMLTDIATWERLKALGIEQWLRRKRQAARSGRWASLTTEIPICSASLWMPGTGISVRSSITIWTSTPRQVAGVCITPTKKAFP